MKKEKRTFRAIFAIRSSTKSPILKCMFVRTPGRSRINAIIARRSLLQAPTSRLTSKRIIQSMRSEKATARIIWIRATCLMATNLL